MNMDQNLRDEIAQEIGRNNTFERGAIPQPQVRNNPASNNPIFNNRVVQEMIQDQPIPRRRAFNFRDRARLWRRRLFF